MPINPQNSVAVIQPGGAGQRILWLHPETDIDAISGGDLSYEYDWAGLQYRGARRTSNPGAFTGTINSRKTDVSEIRKLASQVCLFNFILAYGCKPDALTEFDYMEVYVDAGVTSLGSSDQVSTRTTGSDPKLMDNLGFSAGVRVELKPLGQADITGTVIGSGINDIIPVASARCASYCGGYLDGTEEWIAVADPVSPATTPNVLYTANSGNSWTTITLTGVDAVLTGVAVAGDRVIVTANGTNGGVFVAPLSEVRAGATTFTLAAGISAGADYNAVAALGMNAIAVGASGLMAVSRDGGYSWTALTSGVAVALNEVAMLNETTAVAVGASGRVIRVENLARATAFNPSLFSAVNLTSVAIPPNRSNEVYIGGADGNIYKSTDINAVTPTWAALSFNKPSGGGSINDLAFGGPNGVVLFVLQEDSGGNTRVLVDYSGGYMGAYVKALQPFTSAIGASGNAIGVASGNFAMWVGEADSTYGTIARVSAAGA